MGAMIKDTTTHHVLVQLNSRFEPGDALQEMTALQKEFQIFSKAHSLRQSFALLNIVPPDWSERNRWYRFLDQQLKKYPSDIPRMNGHDRVMKALKDDLEARNPLPVYLTVHAAKEDERVKVSEGTPKIFSAQRYLIISIPTTPAREARQRAAETARARRAKRGAQRA